MRKRCCPKNLVVVFGFPSLELKAVGSILVKYSVNSCKSKTIGFSLFPCFYEFANADHSDVSRFVYASSRVTSCLYLDIGKIYFGRKPGVRVYLVLLPRGEIAQPPSHPWGRRYLREACPWGWGGDVPRVFQPPPWESSPTGVKRYSFTLF